MNLKTKLKIRNILEYLCRETSAQAIHEADFDMQMSVDYSPWEWEEMLEEREENRGLTIEAATREIIELLEK